MLARANPELNARFTHMLEGHPVVVEVTGRNPAAAVSVAAGRLRESARHACGPRAIDPHSIVSVWRVSARVVRTALFPMHLKMIPAPIRVAVGDASGMSTRQSI